MPPAAVRGGTTRVVQLILHHMINYTAARDQLHHIAPLVSYLLCAAVVEERVGVVIGGDDDEELDKSDVEDSGKW